MKLQSLSGMGSNGQLNAADSAQLTVTGEDKKKIEARIAASKTVIIENISLDLGLTAKDIQKFLLDQLIQIGERDIEIVDIDLNHGPTSIAVELLNQWMVDKIKKLDGIACLGEFLKVRRVNEETAQTNAQAAAITLTVLKALTNGASSTQTQTTQDTQINVAAGSLKTLNQSSVIKVSNVFDREEELTADIYEELLEDMQGEFEQIPHLKRIKIVRNGEEKLGAEVGSVFVEFRDKKSAEIGLKKMKGRIYDGKDIKCCYVDEKLYYSGGLFIA